MQTPPKLFTPGPVDIFPETQEALGRPIPHMSDPAWHRVYAETQAMLHTVLQTDNDIIVMTAPGSGAIETGLGSLFQAGEQAIVVNNGMFAGRILQILDAYGCQAIAVDGPWGEAIALEQVADTLRNTPGCAGIAVVGNETGTGVRNPVRELAELAHSHDLPIFVDAVSGMGGYDLPVDRWDLDMVATSSNKALEMAPGLGILSVNNRSWELMAEKVDKANQGWYYKLATWKQSRERKAFPFPSTPPTLLISGLHASLKRILEVETLEGHWKRYEQAQRAIRSGLGALGFEMLADEAVASPTITTVYKRPEMQDIEVLRDYLLNVHNILIATGGGPLAGQIARIGHMGKASTPEYVDALLNGIEAFLHERT